MSTRPVFNSPRPPAPPPRSDGVFAVAVLLILGIGAGLVSVTYWSRYVKPAIQNAGASTGLAPTPRVELSALDAEHEKLANAVNEGMAGKQLSPALVGDVRTFCDKNPDYAPGHTLLAQVLMFQGKIQDAYDAMLRSLSLDNRQLELELLAGTVALQLDKTEQSEQHYRNAVNLDPAQARPHVHLAGIYMRRRDLDRARDSLLTALRLNSGMHEAYYRLSEVYAQQNKLVAALTQIDKAIQHSPAQNREIAVQYVRQKARILRRDNRPEEAVLVLMNSLSEEERSDDSVLDDLALALAMQNRFVEAAELYEAQAERRPFEWKLPAAAAQWRLKAGDKAAAKALTDAVKRIDARQPIIAELEAKLAN